MTVTAQDFLPARLNLTSLRRAAARCQGCELYRDATQTVFGEGLRSAPIVVVGEMPGDEEDRRGAPFVGPAGRLLRESLVDAGLALRDVYLTNAVKHFRWEPRGGRRLHKSPGARHIEACKPWLQAEILMVEPRMIVALGAVAAKALIGRAFRVTRQRGQVVAAESGARALATYHPAAILRAPTPEDRRRMRKEFTADLARAANALRT